MDIPLNDILKLNKDFIETNIPKEEFNEFMGKKLASKHFKDQGFEILNGQEFESNLLLVLNQEKEFTDRYIKVKIWKEKLTKQIAEYDEKMLKVFGIDAIKKLLHICRINTPLGAPGLPDIISLKDEGFFVFVDSEEGLEENQLLFILLSKVLGLDFVKVVQAVPQGYEAKPREINVKDLIEGFYNLDSKKLENLENHIQEINIELSKDPENTGLKDEIDYLEKEKFQMPLNLLKTFLEKNKITKEDLEKHYTRVSEILESEKSRIKSIMKEVENDAEFQELGNFRDEATLRKKKEFVEKRFGLGHSRSVEIINLF